MAISGGFLLLGPKNIAVLGGTVSVLYEKWKLAEVRTSFTVLLNALSVECTIPKYFNFSLFDLIVFYIVTPFSKYSGYISLNIIVS